MTKLGNLEEEIEDAYCFDEGRRRFSLADGEGESIFSDIWAKSLALHFVGSPGSIFISPSEVLEDVLRAARHDWYEQIDWQNLEWWKANKAVEGSKSTILGMEIGQDRGDKDQLQFKAICIGDSCLIKVGENGIATSFPIEDPNLFNNAPSLVWSGFGYPVPRERTPSLPQALETTGTLRPGERIILATDSVSSWLLKNKTEETWRILLDKMSTENDLKQWFTGLIDSKAMKNDDLTVMVVSTVS